MRELLYDAARHYKRGKALADRSDVRGAMAAFDDALNQLHAVKPQQLRDVLLAQVYLSRSQVCREVDPLRSSSDLRTGYSYARTTREPTVRELAERLWQEHLANPPKLREVKLKHRPEKAEAKGGGKRGGKRRRRSKPRKSA